MHEFSHNVSYYSITYITLSLAHSLTRSRRKNWISNIRSYKCVKCQQYMLFFYILNVQLVCVHLKLLSILWTISKRFVLHYSLENVNISPQQKWFFHFPSGYYIYNKAKTTLYLAVNGISLLLKRFVFPFLSHPLLMKHTFASNKKWRCVCHENKLKNPQWTIIAIGRRKQSGQGKSHSRVSEPPTRCFE